MDAPKSLDEAGAQITVKVGAAKGSYAGMPASRSYVVDLHVPGKPAGVKLGDRALPMFQAPAGDRAARDKARAAFDAAPEGWMFDQSDRRGVLHVRLTPQALAAGFVVKVTM